MESEYTWASLGTSAGCAAAVLLITQYIKGFLPKWLPTRLMVWLLAFLFLLGASAFGENALHISDIPLMLINSCAVALTAMGAYETALADRTKSAPAIAAEETKTTPETPATTSEP